MLTAVALATLAFVALVLLLACLGMAKAIKRLEAQHERQAQLVDAFTQMVLAQQELVATCGEAVNELLRAYPVDSDAAQRIRDTMRRTLAVGVDASKVRVH